MTRLNRLVLLLVIGCCAINGFANEISILPLGDSITQSHSTQYSYRYSLWKMLLDEEVVFDFIGMQTGQVNGSPDWPDYLGQSFDYNHEGHAGWRTDEILNGRDGGDPNVKLATWLTSYTPDIALLHIGTVDVMDGSSAASTAGYIGQIIDLLQADNSDVTILLAKLIGATSTSLNAGILAINATIDGIAANKTTATSQVLVVDQYSGFDPAVDTWDGIHPDLSGEQKIAQKWLGDIVPEPATISLMVLAALVGFRRRR